MTDKSYLCIDIGTNSIKVLEKDSMGRVLQWGVLERSGKIFHSSIQPMRPEDVASSLGRLLAAMSVQSYEAAMSVAPFYVFTALSEVVDPGLVPACPGAYKLQGMYLNDGRYFFAAIPRDVEQSYRRIGELAGLRLIALEPASFALADSFKSVKGSVLIVDSDHRCTTYTAIQDGVVNYVFRSDFGSDSKAADVIINKAREIAATRRIDQLVLSKSVFNVAHGLQKVSQQITDRYRG